MKINLFTSFYEDANPERQKELVYCLYKNAANGFDKITIVTELSLAKFHEYLPEESCKEKNIEVLYFPHRPTFNHFFDLMSLEGCADAINIVCNTDIFFQDLSVLKAQFVNNPDRGNICLALSRWDYFPYANLHHHDTWDSQDTWCFYGIPRVRTSLEFTAGKAGCDNRLAHDIEQAGYNVINPSKTVMTYHYHVTGVRNYIDANGEVKERIPPPYKMVVPYS